MQKQTIIGLVGQIGCGKGTIAKYLVKKHKASAHRFSTPLRDVLSRLHLEISRKNMQDISKLLWRQFGDDLLAKIIFNDVKNDKNKLIVVDGIRRLPDIKYLQKIKGFKLVRIVVDQKIRYKRIVARGENRGDRKKTYKQFLADQKRATEVEIPLIMKKAKVAIDNNGDLKDLARQIKKIVNI